MIKVQLDQERSQLENRSSNISYPGEDIAHAQPSVAQEEEEIQNSNFELESSKCPHDDSQEDDRKPAVKMIEQEPEDEPQSWTQEEQKEAPPPMPWVEKKDYQAMFRKCISIGEYGEEHFDAIDMPIEAQSAVRRITDHLEIVKQYQKVVMSYNKFEQDFPWESSGGLTQHNCQFGDTLKDEKRKVSFNMTWEDLWVSMQYPYLWATST